MPTVDAPVDTQKKVNRLQHLPPDWAGTNAHNLQRMTSRGRVASGRPSPRRSQGCAPATSTYGRRCAFGLEDKRSLERSQPSLSDGTSDGRQHSPSAHADQVPCEAGRRPSGVHCLRPQQRPDRTIRRGDCAARHGLRASQCVDCRRASRQLVWPMRQDDVAVITLSSCSTGYQSI